MLVKIQSEISCRPIIALIYCLPWRQNGRLQIMKRAGDWGTESSPAEPWGVSTRRSAGGVQRFTRVGTRRLQPKVFCAAIVLLPCLMVLLAFPIARTAEFALRSQDLYLTNLGYGLTLDHAKCDVMIYGDSSALTGVDPAVIEEHTD